MPYVYRATKGSPLTADEVDGNFHQAEDDISDLQAGTNLVSIESVTSSGTALTVNLTNGTQQGPFPMPVPEIEDAGNWANSTPYSRFDIVTVRGSGIYLVLEDHTTPVAPEEFDPEAVNGSDELLYRLIGSLPPTHQDVAFCVMGTLPSEQTTQTDGQLIGQFVLSRSILMESGLSGAEAWLETPPGDTDGVQIDIERNGTVIGAITWDPGENEGDFSFTEDVNFSAGNRVALRVMASDGVAADLSVTLPAERTDI